MDEKTEQTSVSTKHEIDTELQAVDAKEEMYDLNGNPIHFVMSPEEKKLVRKLDYIYVMPFISILNFLQASFTLCLYQNIKTYTPFFYNSFSINQLLTMLVFLVSEPPQTSHSVNTAGLVPSFISGTSCSNHSVWY